MSASQELSVKETYRSPQVVVYGDIRAITQTATTTGKTNDMGGGGNNKT